MGPALSLDDEENGPVQVADQQLQPQEAVERSERRRALERGWPPSRITTARC